MSKKLKKFNVNIFGNGKPQTWRRFAASFYQAGKLANEAVRREFPRDGRVVSITRSISDDSGHITLPGLIPFGIVVGIVWFIIHVAQTGILQFVVGR